MVTEKICSVCLCKKPATPDFFCRQKTGKDGLRAICKECQISYTRKYESSRKPQRKLRDNLRHARWRYNVDKVALLESQQFRCANSGCSNFIDRFSGNIDHDHRCCSSDKSCGKCVRGILCVNCNLALGQVGDSVKKLRGLADYLECSTRK